MRRSEEAQALAWLRTPQAVRERCRAVLRIAEQDGLGHFTLDLDRLDAAADYVAEVIRDNYPALDVPYHSRWRHFETGGVDRWAGLSRELGLRDRDELARIRFDLCVTSVLLDAGAGPDWRYEDAESGQVLTRSEGLAIASFNAFRAGLFSSETAHPLRADAAGLAGLTRSALAAKFQASEENPLVGLDGRLSLMRRLGEALAARPDLFGSHPARIGQLYDFLKSRARHGSLPATEILAAVLDGFSPIWPGRIELAGQNLGDVWHSPRLGKNGPAGDLVPFHKLSQWLTYSLLEVLEDSGVAVSGLDSLTGLPEYRNGGLFIDLAVLTLRDPRLAERQLPVDHEAIVEWRALTVTLLDELAGRVRARLGKSAREMPLACILQGGTWEAGRRIAREKRAGGGPPLSVASDGTVF